MKKNFVIGAFVMVSLISGLNCLGNVIKDKIKLNDISAVDLKCEGNLYLKQGDEDSLLIEVDKDFLPNLDTGIDDNKLSLDIKRGWFGVKDNPGILNYYVTLKKIDKITNSSTGMLKIESNLKSKNLSINSTSSGNIETENQIDCKNIVIKLSSSGHIFIDKLKAENLDVINSSKGNIEVDSGKVRKQIVTLNSSGNYYAEGLISKTVTVNNSSSGNAYLNTKAINSQITSNGNVEISGQPGFTNSHSSSKGKLIIHK